MSATATAASGEASNGVSGEGAEVDAGGEDDTRSERFVIFSWRKENDKHRVRRERRELAANTRAREHPEVVRQ